MTTLPIESFAGEYRWLSNFWPAKVWIMCEGRKLSCSSVEHAYQALKTNSVTDRKLIASCKSAAEAKELGKHVQLRSDWTDECKLRIMHLLIKQKFTLNPDLKLKLLETGDALIVEGNWWGDRFWGICRGEGQNHLGKIIMHVRDELKPKE